MRWAAYGDALGFITELCDKKTLKYRTNGVNYVTRLIDWKRKLGGRYGVSINLPKGCYSDDTQLRLAVCRSIKKDGHFDVETFSKIEIPVFLAYSLGMGRATKVAGESLQKKNIQWNTNFFQTNNSSYINGGGNGAAMRIQPHIWAASTDTSSFELISEIMRDTIITHGHPIGWVGAIFHGLILHHTLLYKTCPPPERWMEILDKSKQLVTVCREDQMLKDIWTPTWERISGIKFEQGVSEAINDISADINKICHILKNGNNESPLFNINFKQKYKEVVNAIDGFNPKVRGSATKTALLSTYIAYAFSKNPHKGIEICINTLGSDTDTIATMAGAVLGAITENEPPQTVMDNQYLINQAKRLYHISCGKPVPQFIYPDLLHWNLPKSSLDLIGYYENKIALYGLGIIEPYGEKVQQKSGQNIFYWQFFKTSFGQTVLLKHRDKLPIIPHQNIPITSPENGLLKVKKEDERKDTIRKNEKTQNLNTDQNRKYGEKEKHDPLKSIDEITDYLIKNGFNETKIGRYLLSFADDEDGIEKAIAFSSIIVKAKRARMKRVTQGEFNFKGGFRAVQRAPVKTGKV